MYGCDRGFAQNESEKLTNAAQDAGFATEVVIMMGGAAYCIVCDISDFQEDGKIVVKRRGNRYGRRERKVWVGFVRVGNGENRVAIFLEQDIP